MAASEVGTYEYAINARDVANYGGERKNKGLRAFAQPRLSVG